MDAGRFQQARHGFSKLTAVVREASGWRRCGAGETPHAIVARVNGLDTFSLVTEGEIDGLEPLTVGSTYGVGANGLLTAGASPIAARAVRIDTLFVTPISSNSGSSDVSGITSTINSLVAANLLDEKLANKGVANGYTPLGADIKVPAAYLPADGSETAIRRSWIGL